MTTRRPQVEGDDGEHGLEPAIDGEGEQGRQKKQRKRPIAQDGSHRDKLRNVGSYRFPGGRQEDHRDRRAEDAERRDAEEERRPAAEEDQESRERRSGEAADIACYADRGVGLLALVGHGDDVGDQDAVERERRRADDAEEEDQGEGDRGVRPEHRQRRHVGCRGEEAEDDRPLAAHAIGDAAAEVVGDRRRGR